MSTRKQVDALAAVTHTLSDVDQHHVCERLRHGSHNQAMALALALQASAEQARRPRIHVPWHHPHVRIHVPWMRRVKQGE